MSIYTYVASRDELVALMLDHMYGDAARDLAGRDITNSDLDMDSTLTLLLNHVEGAARSRIQANQIVERTGISDRQWWEMVGPALAEVLDATQFPIVARIGQAAGQTHQAAHDPEHAYSFGVDRLVDGIGSQMSRALDDRVTPSAGDATR